MLIYKEVNVLTLFPKQGLLSPKHFLCKSQRVSFWEGFYWLDILGVHDLNEFKSWTKHFLENHFGKEIFLK